MLVLTRHQGDSILIGDNIRITVVDISRGKVRIGIDAPRGVMILRQEVAAEPGPLLKEARQYQDSLGLDECDRIPQL